MKVRRWQKRLLIVLAVLAAFLLFCYLLQRFWAHRNGYFLPDYPRVTLTEDSDYETIFLQTGLGRSAVDKLLSGGDFQTILNAQDAFFNPPQADWHPFAGLVYPGGPADRRYRNAAGRPAAGGRRRHPVHSLLWLAARPRGSGH